MRLLNEFWNDERGFLVSTETVGLTTLVVCGGLVGWQSVRTAAIAEMADLAEAIGSLDQSYSFMGYQGHSARCSGSVFEDGADLGDTPDDDEMARNGFNRCIQLIDPAEEEPSAQSGSVVGRQRNRSATNVDDDAI